jgi:hypothetical protein
VIFWDARLQRGENGWCGEGLSRDGSGLHFSARKWLLKGDAATVYRSGCHFSAREWLLKDLLPQFTDRAFCWAPESGWLKSCCRLALHFSAREYEVAGGLLSRLSIGLSV